jgi:hypothetical protein
VSSQVTRLRAVGKPSADASRLTSQFAASFETLFLRKSCFEKSFCRKSCPEMASRAKFSGGKPGSRVCEKTEGRSKPALIKCAKAGKRREHSAEYRAAAAKRSLFGE